MTLCISEASKVEYLFLDLMSWGRTLVMLWMFLFAFVIFPLLWIYHLGNINCDDNETVALSHKKCNKKGETGF